MNKRILVVDDEDNIREVAQASLEMVGGHDVLTASSGAEGIEMATRHKPDAILLDVMMPDMDGPATFQRLQAGDATRAIPVILLTAKVQATDQRSFERLGGSGLLSKPFDPMTLPDQVAHALGW